MHLKLLQFMMLNKYTVDKVADVFSEMKRNFPEGMDIIQDNILAIAVAHLRYKALYPEVKLHAYGPLLYRLIDLHRCAESSKGDVALFRLLDERLAKENSQRAHL
jgi:hypothetical protein